ncbi:MAG: hypothetical protein ACR2RF_32110 [Geminicoccaceae bacterium]
MNLTSLQKLERQLVVEGFVQSSGWFFNNAYAPGYHVREALRFLRQRVEAGDSPDTAIGRLENWAWEREDAAELRTGPTALGLNPSQG